MERWRKRLLPAVGAVSFVSAAVIWAVWIEPVDRPLAGHRQPNWWGPAPLVLFISPIALLLLRTSQRHWSAYAAAAVASPLLAIVLALALRDDYDAQVESKAVFRSYTHRFPPGRLGKPELESRTGPIVVVCADEAHRSNRFCLDMDLRHRKGAEVEGGYRLPYEEYPLPYECFGRNREEGQCDYLE